MNQALQERPELRMDRPEPGLPEGPKPKRKRGLARIVVPLVIIAFGLIAFLLYYNNTVNDAKTDSAQASGGAFADAREQARNEAYEAAYGKAYDTARESFRSTNTVTIQIGKIEEIQSLEVLHVSSTSIQINNGEQNSMLETVWNYIARRGENVTSWLEIPGSGVFTVDLKAAEFITDDARQMVLIRLPAPQLTQFSVSATDTKVYKVGDSVPTQLSDPKDGYDVAREQVKNAQLEIQQEISENQDYYQAAKSSAVTQLTTLVRQLNPALPDLEVIVEFID